MNYTTKEGKFTTKILCGTAIGQHKAGLSLIFSKGGEKGRRLVVESARRGKGVEKALCLQKM
ncbi:MAG TPA: hypothetical protein VEC06_12775 [Paucimonas sp.]|nr:hypothetical protein [Paucimonas sp.]